jgi:5-methylthioadenosine/S-adenosylhomocysteine deaminase
MIEAAHTFATDRHCDLHVHVAEAQYEGAQTLERFGATPVRLLERIGVLDERLVAIHAIYLDDEEKDLLARSGARVVHNPTTNQYLGDGICDVVGLRDRGVTVGLGTDADVRPSIFDEMRAASRLQKLARRDAGAMPAACAFDLGTAGGARAIGVAAGDFRVGAHADYAVLNAGEIDPWSPPLGALVGRGVDAWVQATFVGGKRVYFGEGSPIRRQAEAEVAQIARRVIP